MSLIKAQLMSAFSSTETDRAEKNIDQIKASLIATNKLFARYSFFILLSLFSYHLILMGNLVDITLFGIKIGNRMFILKWLLVVPSYFLFLNSTIGYLRVYQSESIEYLLAIHYEEEYKSDIFRISYPPNYILSLDLMRRIDNNFFVIFVGSFIAFISTILPALYIFYIYLNYFNIFGDNIQITVSFCISSVLIFTSFFIIHKSQKL